MPWLGLPRDSQAALQTGCLRLWCRTRVLAEQHPRFLHIPISGMSLLHTTFRWPRVDNLIPYGHYVPSYSTLRGRLTQFRVPAWPRHQPEIVMEFFTLHGDFIRGGAFPSHQDTLPYRSRLEPDRQRGIKPVNRAKVTPPYSVHTGQFSAVKRRVKASKQHALDLEIDLCGWTPEIHLLQGVWEQV